MMSEEQLVGNITKTEQLSSSVTKRGLMSLQLSSVQAREWFQKRRESVQPWGEFFNFSKFKVPKTVSPVYQRVMKNIERFQSNYLFVILALAAFCILTSPLLILAMAASLGACYIISLKNQEQKLTVMGKEVSVAHQYIAVGILTFPLLWIAGAGGVIFWLIGASMVVILAHAALHTIPDEQEPFAEPVVETV